jgi:hypothetical protein
MISAQHMAHFFGWRNNCRPLVLNYCLISAMAGPDVSRLLRSGK